MKQYEYAVLFSHGTPTVDGLNCLGREGWRLVSVIHATANTNAFYMIREIPVRQDPKEKS